VLVSAGIVDPDVAADYPSIWHSARGRTPNGLSWAKEKKWETPHTRKRGIKKKRGE
jgi:hypothetical protein